MRPPTSITVATAAAVTDCAIPQAASNASATTTATMINTSGSSTKTRK